MKRILLSISLLPALCSLLFADEAAEVIQQSGVKGGFVVHVGCGDGRMTAALKANDSYQVHGLTKDAASVATIRESISATGSYGPVAIEPWDGKGLPYIENYVNLLVIEDAASVAKEEIERVLTPLGVAMARKAGGGWEKTQKAWPKDMDEWTHYAYDSKGNPTSKDLLVGPPNRMQWVGNPRWSRHHDRMSSVSAEVSAGGRVYYIIDEGSRISILMPSKWMLIARDAFNGTVLWKTPIPEWSTHLWPLKSGPTQLARRIVAMGDKVYVTLGISAPIVCLEGATGKVIREYPQTKGTEELLMRNGTIYALVNKEPWRLNEDFAVKQQSDQKRVETEFNWDGKPRNLIALNAESGQTLWQQEDRIAPITMAIDDKRIVYYNGDGLACRDVKTGEVKFTTDPTKRRALYEFNFAPRIILNDNVILYAGGDGVMKGVNADTGKDMWTAPHEKSGYRSLEDVIVAQGLVWNAGTTSGNQTGEYRGFDPLTGELKKSFFPDVPQGTYWFHHRCYMAKATEKYLIPSRTGIEYVDMAKEHWDLNHWVRGACLYGVMPCNGLTYAGPHNCACYPEAKLDGMSVMATSPRYPMPAHTPDSERLTKGPAYADVIAEVPADAKDWPTYRADNARSGYSNQDLKKDLSMAWEVKLTPPLSTTTTAAGLTFVSEVDKHTLHAINSTTGKEAWHFIAGGRVDSPPTYWNGRVFFGGKDGHVYCLRAKDGALVWDFQAAPGKLSHGAWEMVESVWPVHGSVLVEPTTVTRAGQNGPISIVGSYLDKSATVSFVAGRSCFLDGGLWFYRVDAKTGEMVVKENYDDRDPDTGGDLNDRHKTLQMPVALNDILSSDGKWTFLRTQKIGPDGKRVDVGPVSGDFDKQGGAQKGEGSHLFAPMGFLDDSNFHRSYWVYGKSFAGGHGGYFQAGKYAPAGRILVHDDKNVYSYGREAQYYKWTTTMEYTLYATPKAPPEESFETAAATTERKGNSLVLGADGKPLAEQPSNKETQVGHAETLKAQAEAKKNGKGKNAKDKAQAAATPAKAKAKSQPIPGSVQFPDVAVLDPTKTPMTIEAWVFPDSPTGTILHQGGPRVGVQLDIKDKKPQFHVRSDSDHVTSIVSSEALIDGWHHIVGVLAEDGSMALYLDSKQVATGKSPGLVASKPANPLYLGNGNGVADPSAGGYSGMLDQVAIYHKALTPSEVEARFGAPDAPPAGAVLVCNFDNGDSRDSSGNNAHGVGAAVETGKGKVGAALWFKGTGGGKGGKASGSFVKHTWDRFVPIIARSMALAGKTVLVSGAPDMIDEEYAFERLAAKDKEILKELKEQDEALDGKRGAKMWAVNVETGEQSSGLDLTSPPVWDGITIAQGRVYVSTMDGKVQCFGK